MHFVDTHTHLFSTQFVDDIHDVIQRAIENGVDKLFLPNIDVASLDAMYALYQDYPKHCFPMAGLHPSDVNAQYKEALQQIEDWIDQHREQCFGIGETGLDYYWDKSFVAEQKQALQIQIEWAKSLDLPLILHTRESFHDNLEMVSKAQDGGLKGIFHCFTGDLEEAEAVIDAGFLLGIGGVITFKNSGHALRQVLKHVDMKHLVLETDAPYLTPTPYRGKRNESAYIPLIAEQLAQIKDLPLEEVARETTQNALRLFNMD